MKTPAQMIEGIADPHALEVITAFLEYQYDTLLDVIGCYLEWSESSKSSRPFLDRLLKRWGLKPWIPQLRGAALRRAAEANKEAILLNDLAAICLATAEVVVRGSLGRALCDKAQIAIARQTTSPFLSESANARSYSTVLHDLAALLRERRN